MDTNTPPCPSPHLQRGRGVPAWKMGLGGRESWSRGLIDLFLVIKGIMAQLGNQGLLLLVEQRGRQCTRGKETWLGAPAISGMRRQNNGLRNAVFPGLSNRSVCHLPPTHSS